MAFDPDAPIGLALDVAEPRILRDRLTGLVDGRDWDREASGGVAIDFVTHTGFLAPLCLTPAWQTTTTGRYARLKKANCIFSGGTSAADWKDYDVRIAGNTYLTGKGGSGQIVSTATEYPRNQGFYLSWFAFGSGEQAFAQLECGWGTPGMGVSLRFWSDARVEIYEGANKVGEGSIATKNRQTAAERKLDGEGKNLAGRFVQVLVIPCRRRELLVVSPSEAGGFDFVFESITDDALADPEPTITDAGRFWWSVPSGMAQVQLAPIAYETDGWLVGPVRYLRYAPAAGKVPDLLYYYDLPGYGGDLEVEASLVEEDGETPFVPDGVKDTCRIRLDLYGDGSNTYWIYGAAMQIPGDIAYTNASEATNLAPFLRPGAGLEVGEAPDSVRLTLPIMAPAALQAAGAANLLLHGNRAFAATLGDAPLLLGRTEPPDFEESTSDHGRDVMLTVRDWWKAFENYRYKETIPLDGLNLDVAVKYLVQLAGFPDEVLAIDPVDFTLPTSGKSSEGEWAVLPPIGESIAETLRKLIDTYAPNWFIGWVPTALGPRFVFRYEEDLPIAPSSAGFLEAGDEAAYAGAGGTLPSYWLRRFRTRVLEPEANDIWISGVEPRTGNLIQSHYTDEISQDPTLAPSERPDNWLGEIRPFGLLSLGLTTQRATDWVASVLATRLTQPRRLVEWECEMMVRFDGAPVWRGDAVYIDGWGIVRIRTITVHIEKDANAEAADAGDPSGLWRWRDARYTGEIILES